MNSIFFEISLNVQSESSKSFIRAWIFSKYLDYGCNNRLIRNKIGIFKAENECSKLFLWFSVWYMEQKNLLIGRAGRT